LTPLIRTAIFSSGIPNYRQRMTLPSMPGDPTSGETLRPSDLSELVREELAQQRALRDGGTQAATSGRSGTVRLLVGAGLLVVGLIALLIRAAVLHDKLGFWQYVWLTVPVALGASWLGYRLGIGRGLSLGHASGLIISTLGTSYLTGISSGTAVSHGLFNVDINCMLRQQTTCAAPAASESPLQSAQRIATNYWDLYGPKGIISAIAVGLVIGVGLALVANRNLRRN
jgi:hypothetical protein